MDNGWVKLHRKFLDWEWYDCPHVTNLFIHCLLKANYKKKKWRGNVIPRGTFITSLNRLKEETGLSLQNIRTALEKLESTGEVNKRTTSVSTWLTVVNYDDYQRGNKEVTKEQQATNTELTTTKKDNKGKKEKNIPPTREEVQKYFSERGDMILSDIPLEAENFINHYSDQDWKNGSGKKIKSWKRQAATWNNKYLQYNEDRLKNNGSSNGEFVNLEIPGAS